MNTYARRLFDDREELSGCYSPAPFPSRVLLSPPPPPPPPPPTVAHHFLLSKSLSAVVAVLSAAFLLGVFYVTMARWYQRRHSSRRAMQPQPPALDRFLEDQEQINYIWYVNTVGLDESLIASITKCNYKKGEGLIEDKDCAVCLSEFQEGEDLRLLPKCSHAFHLECIDRWLRAHVNCPLCRAPIMTNTSNLIPVVGSGAAPSTVNEPQVVDLETDDAQSGNSDSLEIEDADHDSKMLAIDYCVGESSRDPHTEKREGGSPTEFQPIRRSVSMDSLARIHVSMSFGTNSAREFSVVACRGMMATGSQSCEKLNLGKLSIFRGADLENEGEKSEARDLGDVDKQSVPPDMKRSFSIGSNFFFSKHGHNRSSVLPLRA